MKTRTTMSGRKTGGIIALIDQSDNSISICVIQMVFNFPQRYLHSSIYISFVRNRLALSLLSFSSFRLLFSTLRALGFYLPPPLFLSFLSHLKIVAFRILHVVNLSPKLFPVSRPTEIVKCADIKCICNRIIQC